MSDNKLPYNNRAIAVGVLDTMEMIEGEAKESGRKYQYLQCEVKATDSRIRVNLWPTQKKPSVHLDTQKQIQKGDQVSINGILEEQVSEEGRLFRGIRAFGIGPADSGDREDRLVYHVAGHLGDLEKTSDDQYVVPITIVRAYKDAQGEDQEKEDTIRVHPPTDWLQPLYEQFPKGTVIRSRGDIVNQMEIDRYGVVSGFKAELTVALLEVWDENTKLWKPFRSAATAQKQLTQQSPAAPAARPPAANRPVAGVGAAKPPQPTPAGQPRDDEDVPF
ncbi:MAG: hypothetical protein Q8R28_19325 [Dehalococcoidia bacterium]|nr:hypothetical protein [Dehalococcoidia bacterium]